MGGRGYTPFSYHCSPGLETQAEQVPFFYYFYLFIFGWAESVAFVRAFSSCVEWRLLKVLGLLTAVASLVVEHGL